LPTTDGYRSVSALASCQLRWRKNAATSAGVAVRGSGSGRPPIRSASQARSAVVTGIDAVAGPGVNSAVVAGIASASPVAASSAARRIHRRTGPCRRRTHPPRVRFVVFGPPMVPYREHAAHVTPRRLLGIASAQGHARLVPAAGTDTGSHRIDTLPALPALLRTLDDH
jgi:hypothetical protein